MNQSVIFQKNVLVYILIILSIIFFILTLNKAFSSSADGDEFGTIWLASQDLNAWQIIEFIHKNDPHPPTHYLMLHYWSKVFGYSDIAMRSLSVIFLFGSFPLIWLLANYMNPREPYLPLLLSISTPLLWVLAVYTRYYTFGLFAGLLAYLAYLNWLKKTDSLYRCICLILSTTALFYFHYFLSLVAVLSMVLHFLFTMRNRNFKEIGIWVMMQLTIIAGSLPILLWSVFPHFLKLTEKYNAAGLRGWKDIPLFIGGSIYSTITGNAVYPWEIWGWLPLVGALIYIIVKGLKGLDKGQIKVFLFLGILPLLFGSIIFDFITPIGSYWGSMARMLFVVPILWVFIGSTLANVVSKKGKTIAFAVIMCSNIFSIIIWTGGWSGMSRGEPLKEIGVIIDKHTNNFSQTVVLSPFKHGWGHALSRYTKVKNQAIITDSGGGLTPSEALKYIFNNEAKEIWVIQAKRWATKANQLESMIIEKGFKREFTQNLSPQSAFDIWFKDFIKSLYFFDFSERPSHKYLYKVEKFIKHRFSRNFMTERKMKQYFLSLFDQQQLFLRFLIVARQHHFFVPHNTGRFFVGPPTREGDLLPCTIGDPFSLDES